MVESFRAAPILAWRNGRFVAAERSVPAETAVALSVNGSTHAVMMATPDDLEDFAVGLALNERIVAHPDEIEALEIEEAEGGYDCRLWLGASRAATYVAQRRLMTGPVGCGLCGAESLEKTRPDLPRLPDRLRVAPEAIGRAMEELGARQVLGARTRAVHAAAFASADGTIEAVREDVGRHNALDKVAGWLARSQRRAEDGFLVMTSRVSVELVQKAAVMGCELMAAVSAPTALALDSAEEAGLTLAVVARGADFELASHPHRIQGAEAEI
ncbi:formate dehydrogenase accessory sulfurtransferase FdhD [Aureimonas ureilytica]|uniref:formate dehydrogenase accessory sulfurtransferase FdhD n=1 Tax=Aureimonas ureilytica TaxID=401562 RepID=UPI003CE7F8E2